MRRPGRIGNGGYLQAADQRQRMVRHLNLALFISGVAGRATGTPVWWLVGVFTAQDRLGACARKCFHEVLASAESVAYLHLTTLLLAFGGRWSGVRQGASPEALPLTTRAGTVICAHDDTPAELLRILSGMVPQIHEDHDFSPKRLGVQHVIPATVAARPVLSNHPPRTRKSSRLQQNPRRLPRSPSLNGRSNSLVP